MAKRRVEGIEMVRKPVARKRPGRGVEVAEGTRLILGLEGITEGRSYGMPSFLLGGKFFARFRDEDTVLVLQLGALADRDVLMQLAPKVFFFTEHYRDYPAVLIRLDAASPGLFAEVVEEAWRQVSATRPARTKTMPLSPKPRRKSNA
jgi:hypothetical protein